MMKKNFKALVLADNKTQAMDFIFDCDYLIQTTDAPHIIYLDDIQNYLDFL